ncbi:hypothetical protein QTP86_011708 [Hemibagrus guttatus]|nr:hypothetical protein QTP86_011708 [Hemibagrus guttatus]
MGIMPCGDSKHSGAVQEFGLAIIQHSCDNGCWLQSNGQTERLNQELEVGLRILCTKEPTSWSSNLVWVEYAHNYLRLSWASHPSKPCTIINRRCSPSRNWRPRFLPPGPWSGNVDVSGERLVKPCSSLLEAMLSGAIASTVRHLITESARGSGCRPETCP